MKTIVVALFAGLGIGVIHAAEPPATNWEDVRRFWSFQPVRKVEPPIVKDSGWARLPIDRFILAKLEEKGLRPVEPADPRTLIRRLTFDLTGLPPTPGEVETFVKEYGATPQAAYEKLVDRLLASPQYGEMQARNWLDIARYAEDQAHTFGVKPNTNAYRYRDWVVDAFNNDLPYDRFVKLQIAADLMDDGSAEGVKNRAALGFFGLGAQYYKSSNPAKAIAEELDDKLDTLTRGFLGLTIACARCHDHKFDPIPTQDYYSLAGVFASSRIADMPLATAKEQQAFQEGQKAVAAADKKVKDLLQVEKDKRISAIIESLPSYFVAAWKLEAGRLIKPELPAAEHAKKDGLDAGALDRLTKFLNRKGPSAPAIEGWLRNLPKMGAPAEPPQDVVQAAGEFRDAVKSAMTMNADKSKSEMVHLFGDKGVFPIVDAEVIGKMTPECRKQYDALKNEHEMAAKAAPPALPTTHGLAEGTPTDMKIAIRGNPLQPGNVAPRRFLQVMAGENPPLFQKGSGRLDLADAIADAKNPLTARVMVNRIWQQHFGRGIVGTPSNFGKLGEEPTHPELLDYLAARFVESGWSVKKIHREIVLSATYQLASTPLSGYRVPKSEDPDNRLLWRMSRQRLMVEEFRDALLAVSGRLDSRMGGPTVNLDDASNTRRSLYGKISRHELSGFLRLFDFPDANITSDRRSETTVPQQQLFVLNSEFMMNQARAFAARMQKEGTDDPSRIRRGYLLAFGRPANDDEVALGQQFLGLKDSSGDAAKNKLSRWERYAQALLASNEFMYID